MARQGCGWAVSDGRGGLSGAGIAAGGEGRAGTLQQTQPKLLLSAAWQPEVAGQVPSGGTPLAAAGCDAGVMELNHQAERRAMCRPHMAAMLLLPVLCSRCDAA